MSFYGRIVSWSVLVIIGLIMQKLSSDVAILWWEICPISNCESQ